MLLQEALAQLTAYGFIIRTLVEVLQGFWKPADLKRLKAVVVALSAVFVYLLGVDPVTMLKMKAVSGEAAKIVGVGLLAGAAMGTHDLLEALKNLKGVR